MRIIDPIRARTAFTLLLVGYVSNLGAYFLHQVLSALGVSLYGSPGELALQLIWLSISAVFVIALINLANAVDVPTLAWATVALVILNALIELGFALVNFTGSHGIFSWLGSSVSAITMLLSLAERGLLLWLLVSFATPRFSWTLPVAATVMVLSVVRMAFSFALSLQMVDATALISSGVYGWATGVLSLLNAVLALLVAWVARVAVTESTSGEALVPPREQGLQAPTMTDAPASPTADFAFGGVILMIGIVVTSISVSSASNGGRYIVATGAIAVGLGRIIRGFIRLAKR